MKPGTPVFGGQWIHKDDHAAAIQELREALEGLLQADENGVSPVDWENLTDKTRATLDKYKGES